MKTAIVTGAGSGIGKATAKRLVADGWGVTLNGRTESKLTGLCNELGAGDKVKVFSGDVGDRESVADLIAFHLKEFSGLDALVNNAAIASGGKIEEIDPEDWTKLMRINVDGVFHTCALAKEGLGREWRSDCECFFGQRDWRGLGFQSLQRFQRSCFQLHAIVGP